jgi:hypothetical protein
VSASIDACSACVRRRHLQLHGAWSRAAHRQRLVRRDKPTAETATRRNPQRLAPRRWRAVGRSSTVGRAHSTGMVSSRVGESTGAPVGGLSKRFAPSLSQQPRQQTRRPARCRPPSSPARRACFQSLVELSSSGARRAPAGTRSACSAHVLEGTAWCQLSARRASIALCRRD